MTRSGENVSAPEPPKQRTARTTATGRWWRRCALPDGPRQRTLCYLGELNSSAQARWLKTIEVFNEQGEAEQLKLFPSQVETSGRMIRRWRACC